MEQRSAACCGWTIPLLGLEALYTAIVTDTESIPKFPEVDQHSDLANQALSNSSTVKAADERAQAEAFRAKAEWKTTYYPSFDFAAQYGLFSNQLNNYEDFFKKFQRNNASFGVVTNARDPRIGQVSAKFYW